MPSAHSYSNFSSSNSSSDMVFVSQSLAAAHQLNEEMEIERIKRIEFPHNDENVSGSLISSLVPSLFLPS